MADRGAVDLWIGLIVFSACIRVGQDRSLARLPSAASSRPHPTAHPPTTQTAPAPDPRPLLSALADLLDTLATLASPHTRLKRMINDMITEVLF